MRLGERPVVLPTGPTGPSVVPPPPKTASEVMAEVAEENNRRADTQRDAELRVIALECAVRTGTIDAVATAKRFHRYLKDGQ